MRAALEWLLIAMLVAATVTFAAAAIFAALALREAVTPPAVERTR